jgi:UDP-glucose 4-epimerase
MKILVTGGSGYIGSHTIVDLLENGFSVVSVDNFLNSLESVPDRIREITGKDFPHYAIDLTDRNATEQIFREHPDLDGLIHFAALKAVGESVEKPLWYYRNNINSLLNVLELSGEYGLGAFIFSSSCSVYGNAEELPVTEETPLQPAESPYAYTKQIGERILQDFSGISENPAVVSLRYFNPAGAHPGNLIGEQSRTKALNLVPVITETAAGLREKVTVFGDDYHTRDGSCIRDYIHIMDLADAHTKALKYLLEGKNESKFEIFNLGIGAGVSVLEAIDAFERVSGMKLNYERGPRRPGDVEAIYANFDKATRKLGWQPKYSIDEIMRTAWEWQKRIKVESRK